MSRIGLGFGALATSTSSSRSPLKLTAYRFSAGNGPRLLLATALGRRGKGETVEQHADRRRAAGHPPDLAAEVGGDEEPAARVDCHPVEAGGPVGGLGDDIGGDVLGRGDLDPWIAASTRVWAT